MNKPRARKIRDIFVKTKKPVNCWGCTKDIPVGTMTTVVVGKYGEQFTRAYWCDDCHDKVGLIEEDTFKYGEFIKCLRKQNKTKKETK